MFPYTQGQCDIKYVGLLRRGFSGGALPAAPPVQSHNDKGGGGGLFPVDLSVQTANT